MRHLCKRKNISIFREGIIVPILWRFILKFGTRQSRRCRSRPSSTTIAQVDDAEVDEGAVFFSTLVYSGTALLLQGAGVDEGNPRCLLWHHSRRLLWRRRLPR